MFTLEVLTLIEIAPGIYLEKDVLGAMDFKPRLSPALQQMLAEIFQEQWGRLRQLLEESEVAHVIQARVR